MLKPLVKRGLFLTLKNGFYPLKWEHWTFLGGISPPRNQFTTKILFWVQRALSQSLPGKLEVRSGNQKKKRKSTLGLNISPPPPNDPHLHTLFVSCMWGGVTDVITHAKFHLNRFSSFSSPWGRNSPFPIGLENGSYNSVTH